MPDLDSHAVFQGLVEQINENTLHGTGRIPKGMGRGLFIIHNGHGAGRIGKHRAGQAQEKNKTE
jgi:hypothetical protein